MLNKKTLVTTVSLILISASCFASTLSDIASSSKSSEDKGLLVAKEVEKSTKNFGDSIVSVDMILKDSGGSQKLKSLTTKTLEGKGGSENKSITIFDKPNDSKGIALLTIDYKDKDDEQWLYLPEVKREKRISSSNKSGSFVGSQFSFEDLSVPNINDYKYKYLRNEKCGSFECLVIERYPLGSDSGYNKHIVWIDSDKMRVMKVEYYDRKDSLLKTLNMSDYKEYDGRWRANKSEMINHQNGKSTELVIKNCSFNNGLTDNDFTKNAMKLGK